MYSPILVVSAEASWVTCCRVFVPGVKLVTRIAEEGSSKLTVVWSF